MDSHSKNVFFIGILHIVGYSLFCLEYLTRAISMLFFREHIEGQVCSTRFISLFCNLGLGVLIVILASLMIRGVIKKSYLLVAPFFIFCSLILMAGFVMFLLLIFKQFQFSAMHFYQYHLYILALHIMILYPVYTLMMKFRLRALKEKALEGSLSESKNKPIKIVATV